MTIALAYLDIFIKLFTAVFLGALMGTQRTIVGKKAGMRTYALVSMGACLFVSISEFVNYSYIGNMAVDPLRMASQIIVGIGFLGAGLIIFQPEKNRLQGLTTAAGMWVAAGVGTAVGFSLYGLALVATILTIVVFSLMWYIEKRVATMAGLDIDEHQAEK